jgi:tRNA uridine 5-carboxymethylaminomethyl modification enzyme
MAVGVETYLGMTFHAKSIILTAGTFLNGLMHIGRVQLPGGRCAEPPSLELSESIAAHGIRVARMKTGTPVRIDARSVDFSLMTEQPGDTEGRRFSFYPIPAADPLGGSLLPCWITYTNEAVHERLRAGLPDSPLYNGQIQSIGPRYCPSIETKLVTFPDKDQHQLFLEPEGTSTNDYYLNGSYNKLQDAGAAYAANQPQDQPDTEEQDEPDENPDEETDDRFMRKKRRKKYKNGGM